MVFLVYQVKPRAVNPKNRVLPISIGTKTPKIKTEKITVVVYSPWTREVVSSNLTSQTKWKYAKVGELGLSEMNSFIQRNKKSNKIVELKTVVF